MGSRGKQQQKRRTRPGKYPGKPKIPKPPRTLAEAPPGAGPTGSGAAVDVDTCGPEVDTCRQANPTEPAGTGLELLTTTWQGIEAAIRAMSPKHVLFARRVAEGVTQQQAAIDAGYSPQSAASTGSTLAATSPVKNLVELLQSYDILTEAHIAKPRLRHVLTEVMGSRGAAEADRVGAVRAAMRLEGYDRVKVEMSGQVAAVDGEALRKELGERLARLAQGEAK